MMVGGNGLNCRIRGDHSVGVLGMLRLCHDLTTGLKRIAENQKDLVWACILSEDLQKLVRETADMLDFPSCQNLRCSRAAIYGWNRRSQLCESHSLRGMVPVQLVTCQLSGCDEIPTYDYPGQPSRKRFCVHHKLDGMVLVPQNAKGKRMETSCKHKLEEIESLDSRVCEHTTGCSKKACFNFEDQKDGRFCGDHKVEGMWMVTQLRVCEHDGCTNEPSSSWKGGRARFCTQHKLSDTSAFKRIMCESTLCIKSGSFNYKGESQGRLCAKHKLEGMVKFKYSGGPRICRHDGCSKGACFNFEGERRGVFCAAHKLETMVNVMARRCEEKGCKKTQPRFNFPNEKQPKFCLTHKKSGMVSVLQLAMCKEKDCSTRAYFNYPGIRGYVYCAKHKLEGMTRKFTLTPEMRRLKVQKCKHPGCEKQPSYNFEGVEHKFTGFCAQHHQPGMINFRMKRCEMEGCKLSPQFNYLGETRRRFCAFHKKPGMLDVARAKFMCEQCSTNYAAYNYEGQPNPRFCSIHKIQSMVNVKGNKCKHPGCKVHPSYGYESQKTGRYCVQHKEPGMIYRRRYVKPSKEERGTKHESHTSTNIVL